MELTNIVAGKVRIVIVIISLKYLFNHTPYIYNYLCCYNHHNKHKKKKWRKELERECYVRKKEKFLCWWFDWTFKSRLLPYIICIVSSFKRIIILICTHILSHILSSIDLKVMNYEKVARDKLTNVWL